MKVGFISNCLIPVTGESLLQFVLEIERDAQIRLFLNRNPNLPYWPNHIDLVFAQDNLMRKLACKTLMEILPADVGTKISEEIKEKKLSVDFDTVVGLVVG